MALSCGTRLGPYEIVTVVGAGGMGEVYRAKDTRLDRIVAIKILPADLSSNPDLRKRFDREARAISSLSHPHICSLFDIGHQDGIDYLVMEFLEGETLAQRLTKGALTLEFVLRYGIQIADALDKAHNQGIVHRDLKPANIMLTKSGVKLLDFGLAKLRTVEDVSSASELSTQESALTVTGAIVGTLQYMSPEQLLGKEADYRTDIFGVGEILYEMATGRKAFVGDNKARLITAILSSQPPPISMIQPLIPNALDHLVRKCLEKELDDRWQSAHDLASELKWIAEGGSQTVKQSSMRSRSRMRERLAWAIAAVLLFVTLALTLGRSQLIQRDAPADPQKFSMLFPEGTVPDSWGSFSISPNGRQVAFVATTKEGVTTVWVRTFDSLTSVSLSGTENAIYPFWSPDSQFIGFFANGKLKKIHVTSEKLQELCDSFEGRGGSWNKDGVILFGQHTPEGLYRVSSSGGEATLVTTLDSSHQEVTHRWPYFLPDGYHFLYLIRSKQRQYSGIYLGSLNSKEKRRLLPDETKVEYAPSGFLVFIRGTNLMAQPFDSKELQLTSDAVPVAERVKYEGLRAYGAFAVSQTNVLTYTSAGRQDAQLVWWDRAGKQIGTLGTSSVIAQPSLSPDEKKLLVEREDAANGTSDLWMVELSRGIFSRFTFDPANDFRSSWSPDGSQIVFSSTRNGRLEAFQKPSSGGSENVLISSESEVLPDDWSRDGRYILYEVFDPKTKSDLLILPMLGDRKPIPYIGTEFFEVHGQFSPNGKWVAYVSNESGRPEVYVTTFPSSAGGKWQISTDGGDHPQWRRDGKELYYISPDKKLMAVQIKSGETFEASLPISLFLAPVSLHLFPAERNQYVVTTDGKRFLFNQIIEDSSLSPMTVVLNWTTLVKK
ncbi:serine/threonine-protein kinase [bacterium]|nr:serine/threonine-protein kinase [bacterium]